MIKLCKKHERYCGGECIDCIRKVPSIAEQKKKLEIILKKANDARDKRKKIDVSELGVKVK